MSWEAPTDVLVQVYEPHSAAYAEAYRTFVSCTNQKKRTSAKLRSIIGRMSCGDTLIDVGAGDGMFTRWFADQFGKTVGIEPNPYFAESFRGRLPKATIFEGTLGEIDPGVQGDLVLCANVMFHVPRHDWYASALRMTKWVKPAGALVFFLQSRGTDCIKMLNHYGVWPGNLRQLGREILEGAGNRFGIAFDEVHAFVETEDASAAYQVAEFQLNCLPPESPPSVADFHQYVDENFKEPSGRYKFSCHLDCLIVRALSEQARESL